MARRSDVRTSQMPSSSRDSSPDPLELPTSPLARHSPVRRQSSKKRSPSPRKVGRPRKHATPAKSVILDTPGAGDASPWRIKVTVEAEPREGSPGKRIIRTTTVPLKDETSKRSSSPGKRASPRKGTPAEPKKSVRKRKGTPIRDIRPARPPPQREVTPEVEEHRSHSPARRASGRLARLSGTPGSARSKRLSYAREELDQALQAAVGMSDGIPRCDAPGDKTVSMNEDFSMISVDSLQATKEHGLSNSMRSLHEGDKSAATVSYMASSPPKPQYPDLSSKAEMARSTFRQPAVAPYESISKKSISLARSLRSSQLKPSPFSRQPQSREISDEDQRQQERETVSREIQAVRQEDVILVDDERRDDGDEDEEVVVEDVSPVDDMQDDADLWQTEASREVEASMRDSRRSQRVPIPVSNHPPDHEPQFEDLFADQPLKPARSKIPRTWRRSSGMDFEYVDSPAHQPALEDIERAEERRNSTDGSGVLTPPETEDDSEEAEQIEEAQPAGDEEEEESDFEPDAEATRVHGSDVVPKAAQLYRVGAGAEDGTMSDEDVNPDGRDTGNLSAMKLPQVYSVQEPPKRRGRPPRKPSMNLTELLNLDGTNSPVKPAVTRPRPEMPATSRVQIGSSSSHKKSSPLQARRVDSAVNHSSSLAESSSKSISSPLRKSLLRSSKVPDFPATAETKGKRPELSPGMPAKLGKPRSGFFRRSHDDDFEDSFEGKTSDQQQLLQEARAISRDLEETRPVGRTQLQYIQEYAREYSNSQDIEMSDREEHERPRDRGKQPHAQHDEDDLEEGIKEDEESRVHEPSKSYEEHLNLDSPGKVKVNFNDSKNSSLLAPTRHYPPLFDQRRHVQQPVTRPRELHREHSPSTKTLIDNKSTTTTSAQTGLLTRLTSTFWSVIKHPIAPVIMPTPQPQSQSEPATESLDANFPPALRAKLRERYGIVHDSHPWTMHHMRTLHRMLNSLLSGRPDTLIPSSGPLPLPISRLTNQTLIGITGYNFVFTQQLGYVVWAFFQLRMPGYILEQMERGEMEWLGDGMAEKCRGYFDERHGSEELFRRETHGNRVADWVEQHEGVVDVNFVVRALGVCVKSNEEHGGP
ncbi:hypothetical protein DOTSEDRAFT_78352 [Dothistroma septosporum NZE10]|uniref:Uncharacterized protein n=1 Tax=Dothistroma septosporum (strain NZE10 / CBS 128990) TaxID=675120 RepID=N1PTZ9_DOTSN|nr:hypothetical protein DOTSEDRAFT_78352 [Dothistroma septosporum NZE10]